MRYVHLRLLKMMLLHVLGAFLIPYCLALVSVGFPMLFLEMSFGQFASLGPITIWRICPLFKGT